MPNTEPQAAPIERKPGWKTTEFWLAVATVAATLLADFAGVNVDPAVLVTVGGSVAAYAISRGLAKKPF